MAEELSEQSPLNQMISSTLDSAMPVTDAVMDPSELSGPCQGDNVFYISCALMLFVVIFQVIGWAVRMCTVTDEDYLREYF